MRELVDSTTLYNAIVAAPEVFTRVDSGTYALAAWGMRQADPYVSIVARVLADAGRPLAVGEIRFKVNAMRPIKSGSLQMLLDLNPRFYRSINGLYGLRAWIPNRDQQNLRIPDWQVEHIDSFQRVTRAEAKGYDISAIVNRDLSDN
jgi:hypothetical protein